MSIIDWNYERKRTRDRLIEYNLNIIVPTPYSAGLLFLYPRENLIIKQLENLIEGTKLSKSEEE